MFFDLTALVPNAPDKIISSVMGEPRLANVTDSGTLVIHLSPDCAASCAAYPDEWQDQGPGTIRLFRFTPDFSGGTVHTIFSVPDTLTRTHYRLVLKKAEAHDRGSYCQVVTGYHGERLRPNLRYARSRPSRQYAHPTVSFFAAATIGMLRLDANAAQQRGHLTIRRAKIAATDRIVTMATEQLLSLDDPRLATHRLDQLSPDLAAWQPALNALYKRWGCDATRCDGHYHLD